MTCEVKITPEEDAPMILGEWLGRPAFSDKGETLEGPAYTSPTLQVRGQ